MYPVRVWRRLDWLLRTSGTVSRLWTMRSSPAALVGPAGCRTPRGRAGNRAPARIGAQRQGRGREGRGQAGGRRSKQPGLQTQNASGEFLPFPWVPLLTLLWQPWVPKLRGRDRTPEPALASRPGPQPPPRSAQPPPGLLVITLPRGPSGSGLPPPSVYRVVQCARPMWHHSPPTCPKYRPRLSPLPLMLSSSVKRFPHWEPLVSWLSI